jgi:glutamate/tyrosine decarboxylase-like PLP-dependent enzyme
MKRDHALAAALHDILGRHREWESGWPAFTADASVRVDPEETAAVLRTVSERLRENYPHFHPLYAGQMLKPPHPVAIAAQLAAMLVNPNNHALDGGRATAAMEKECITALAGMFGYDDERYLGHLTASGTIANLEALFVAREEHPDLPIVCSKDAHYTHKRMSGLLRAECLELPSTPTGTIDLGALDALLAERRIGTLVVTLGTTGLGALDPLDEILARRDRHRFRVHLDMAYGGYFRLLAGTEPALAPLLRTGEADSIVVDPHKHGLQPYGSGCVLFRDGAVSRHYAHASPYTYFSSPEHHPGETTLECSRAGAAAAGLWATLQVFPLRPEGRMAQLLSQCMNSAREFAAKIEATGRFAMHVAPTLDIVTYYPKRSSLGAISAASAALFARAESASEPLYLAKLVVDAERFAALHPEVTVDAPSVTILRSVLMKPEQRAAVDEIVRRLQLHLVDEP